jgi:hypothetical protein
MGGMQTKDRATRKQNTEAYIWPKSDENRE